MLKAGIQSMILAIFLLGLPTLGAFLAGHPASRYFEFPPLTHFVQHAPFSWIVFSLTSLVGVLTVVAICTLYFPPQPSAIRQTSRYRFPGWGWWAMATMLLFWILAWNRFRWLGPWQSLSFTGLWLSYIFLVNAVSYWRSGSCYVTHRPLVLTGFFPASALFWWYFEYLNRFVQNWHYLGIEGFSAGRYVLQSTLAFSTVIPAVMSTLELLKTFVCLSQTRKFPRLVSRLSRGKAWIVLALSSSGLMGIAVWPDYLFPFVWMLPTFILLSLLAVSGRNSILSNLERGDWHEASLAMLSALLCGLFWEMWNYWSDPKWIYSVPFVERFHIFEMPLLGYLGYLPFGLECLVVADQVTRCLSLSRS